MAKKSKTLANVSKKPVAPADDLTATTEGGIELTEAELSRTSGGFSLTQSSVAFIMPVFDKD